MSFRYFLVVAGFFLFIGAGILFMIQMDVGWYIDPSAFLGITLIAFSLCFAPFSPREIFRSYALAFRKPVEKNASAEIINKYRQDLETGILYFSTLNKFLILTSILLTMISVAFLITNIEDKAAIGPGIAITLLAPFYAVITMIVITTPFRSALRKKLVQM